MLIGQDVYCRPATAGRVWDIGQKKRMICTEFSRRRTDPAGGGGADDMGFMRPGR